MVRIGTWLGTVLALAAIVLGLRAARQVEHDRGPRPASIPLRVVATTGFAADLARQVGGDRVDVTALMGPGVDPHLYKASEGDVNRLTGADLVAYQGLHLEGRMAEVLHALEDLGTRAVALTDGIPRDRLLRVAGEGTVDPHVWMDVMLWADCIAPLVDALSARDPEGAESYRRRADGYRARLAALHDWAGRQVARIPPDRRVLATAHDAFSYFGRAYDIEVRGVQGISTATEAGAADVQGLAELLAARRIPAVFVEASISPRIVEAVRAAVRARGFDVALGGELFSDSLGAADTPEGTYEGMIRANVNTIVRALGGADAAPPASPDRSAP